MCKDNGDIAGSDVESCVTWDDSINNTVITDCPYFSKEPISEVCHDVQYTIPASVTVSNITSYVCSQFNRMGTHCGECISGYGPAPFLNGANIPCAKCHNHNYLWVIILLLQLCMITVLYFTFVLCECRGTSSPISVMAYFYQVATNSVISNAIMYAKIMFVSWMTILSYMLALNIMAFWNLDFFRFSLPAVCVSPSLTNAQALLFDYIVAFSPVVLTLLSYLFIELHDRGVWLIVRLWKPFNIFIISLQEGLEPQTVHPKHLCYFSSPFLFKAFVYFS